MCEHDVRTLCVSTLGEFLGPDVTEQPKSTRKSPRKIDFSSSAGSCRAKNVKKALSFIVKTPFKSIGEHRKVRELPRKMNIEEVEELKKYDNLQTKAVNAGFSQAETTKIHRRNEHASMKLRK